MPIVDARGNTGYTGAELKDKVRKTPKRDLEVVKDSERRKGVVFSNYPSDSPSGQKREEGR